MDVGKRMGKIFKRGESNMRTTLRGKITLLFMAFALMLALPAVALADDVYNNLDGSIDAAAESIALTEGGTNDTASVLISPTNGDGKNGCNLTSSTVLQVKANSSDATKVKASLVDPTNTSLAKDTFTSCSDSIKVKVEALAVTGSTPVTISLSEVRNNTGASFNLAPATFTVTVNAAPVTNTKPALTLPANITEEATSASGAAVSYTATANDEQDGALTPKCEPASGSTFKLGTTTVNCSVTDSGNLSDSGNFTVTVVDTKAPSLSNVPTDITEEATGPNGAAVSWPAPTANDLVDGNVSVNCASSSGLKSGDTFPLGTTEVTCSTEDAAGNSDSSSFNVKVQDTKAPAIAAHADVNATATGANGALVNYTSPGTTDAVAGDGTANCTPASGSQFAVGSTKVTCTATDGTNTSTSSFNVIVAYSWSNFLQPINATGTQSVFKLGSTVPVKFNLTGASAGITDGTFYLKYFYVNPGDGLGEQEAVATTTGTTGTQFRYSDGQYIYNWNTKGLISKPGNYELRVYSDAAGTVLLGKVTIEIKK
jgi:hypothetical protein